MVDFKSRLNQALDNQDDEMLSSMVHGDYDPFNGEEEAEDTIRQERSMELELQQGKNIAAIMNSELPEYLIQLAKLDKTPEEKVELDSLYTYAAVNARPFTKYVNKVVTIIGACVHYRPPFDSYVSEEDRRRGIESEKKAGYNQILYMLDEFDENEMPIFIKGSEALANHTRAMLVNNGWFEWEKPMRYFITRGETRGAPFTMISMDRVERMRASKLSRQQRKEMSQPH
jgi:hypothetical protein